MYSGGKSYSADGSTLQLVAGQFSTKLPGTPRAVYANQLTAQMNAVTVGDYVTTAAGVYEVWVSLVYTTGATTGQGLTVTFTDATGTVVATPPVFQARAGATSLTAGGSGAVFSAVGSIVMFPLVLAVATATHVTVNVTLADATAVYDSAVVVTRVA